MSLYDFIRTIYAGFVLINITLAVSSIRKQQSKKEKAVSRALVMSALTNIMYLVTMLVYDRTLANIAYALIFALTTGMAYNLFEYAVYTTESEKYYPSWVRYMVNAVTILDFVLDFSNLLTGKLAIVYSFLWSSGVYWDYHRLPAYGFHSFVCYGLIFASIGLITYRLFHSVKINRSKFLMLDSIIIIGMAIHIYIYYMAQFQMVSLSYIIFFIIGLTVYWDTYRNGGQHEALLNQFIMNHLDTMVAMFDNTGRLEVYNFQAEKIFGLQDSDKMVLTVDDFLNDIDLDISLLKQNDEFRFEYDDDIYAVTHTRLEDEESFIGEMFLFRNINEEVATERRSAQLLEGRNDFVTNMTHEIRTPLNAVIGLSEQLLDKAGDDDKDNITIIRNSGRVILRYVDFMFDILAMSDGVFALNEKNFSVADQASYIEREVKTRFNADEHVFYDVRLDPRTPSIIYGDVEVINQILEIILENAFKFTKRGRVVFSTKYTSKSGRNGEMEFVIRDTGVGMTEETLENIYLAFSIGTNVSYKHEKGIGLGLTVAKQLINLMNGTIFVESNVGVGTTVTVTLPITVVDATPVVTNLKRAGLTQYNVICVSVRVLLVEDDPLNARTIIRLLETFKCRVYHAESGEEALIYLSKNAEVDLILMDYLMPGMDGIETAKRIKSSDIAVSKVPIVAVTADVSEGAREKFVAEGLNDCLFKPFERSELGDLLARWLPPDKVVIQEKTEGGM